MKKNNINQNYIIRITFLLIIALILCTENTYALDDNLSSLPIYKIDDEKKVIYSIIANTTANSLLTKINNVDYKIIDTNNQQILDNSIIKTGYRMLTNENEEYKLSIIGDVTKDGIYSINDAKKIALHIIEDNEKIIDSELLYSANINGDDNIKINDVVIFLKYFLSNTIDNPLNIKIIDNELNIFIGDTKQLKVIYEPNDIEHLNITWSSSDESIVSIDNNGKIVANSEGQAIITARTSNGIIDTCKITVNTVPLEEISVVEDNIVLKPGETYQIEPIFSPLNATDKNLTYSSSFRGVVTVDKNGLIKAYRGGTETITVQAKNNSNVKKVINVTVQLAIETVTLSNNNNGIFLSDNTKFRIGAIYVPDGYKTTAGQGFVVTPDYFVACNIEPSSANGTYATLYIHSKSNYKLLKAVTFKKILSHCQDLSYDEVNNSLVIPGRPKQIYININRLVEKDIKDVIPDIIDITIDNKNDIGTEIKNKNLDMDNYAYRIKEHPVYNQPYNNSTPTYDAESIYIPYKESVYNKLIDFIGPDIDITNSSDTTDGLTAVEYDLYIDKWYFLRKSSVDGYNRYRFYVFKDLYNIQDKDALKVFDVAMKGSQGIGSYKGIVLYPHFIKEDDHGNLIPEIGITDYKFRNGFDIYDSCTGSYLKSYYFDLTNFGIVNTSAEIEEVVWNGQYGVNGNPVFYIYFASGYVAKIELDLPTSGKCYRE